MKPDLPFDFDVDAPNATMTINREFAGRRQMVWDCHTQSALLNQWFAPRPLTTKTRSMEFRDGGHWHYAMIMPDGQEYWSRLDYVTIDPIDGYTALDGFSDPTGAINPDLPRATWKVSFSEAGAHTVVRTIVTFASTEDLEKVMAMGMKEGMTSTLERLDDLLEILTKPEMTS